MAILSIFVTFVLAAGIQAQNAAYGQCGGLGWCYNTDCQPGYICTPQPRNTYYSQCLPITVPAGDLAPYSGCGFPNTSPCSPGYACITTNGYTQCVPVIYSLTTVNTCLGTSTSASSTSIKLSTTTTSSTSNTVTWWTKSTFISSSKSSSAVVVTTSSSLVIHTSSKTSSISSKTSSTSVARTTGSIKSASSVVSSTTSTSSSTYTISSKPPTSTSASSVVTTSSSTTANVPQQTPYGQCGGIGWTGPTTCTNGWTCVPQAGNPYYSQCLPGSSSQSPATTTTATTTQSLTTTTTVTKSSMSSSTQTGTRASCLPTPQSCSVTNSPASCAGKVQFAGINIAGCDFGTDTYGNQSPSGAYCPIGPYNPNGPGQMAHFASENFNIFRLPTGWQYIINSGSVSATLDPTNFGNYNSLVQACLSTGAYCLIDIHNYARFNGQIIGQGGPSNAIFAQLWANIATVYASNPKVVFGIMNEPHDLPSITTWAQTVQAVVTAIRNAGATSQMILLPGSDYTGAGTFVSDGSGPALATVTNPDGSTTNLIFDVHKYLDSDGSGTSSICVGDQIASAFAPLAQWLRCNGRQAMLSETGGSNDSSCLNFLCSAIKFLNANSDVYLGYIGWAAGSFSTGYNLGETPSYNNGVWTDQTIVTQCLLR